MPAGPSILFVNRVLPPSSGATGRLVWDLSERMAAMGWRVTIVCDGPSVPMDPPAGVKVARTGSGGPWPTLAGYLSALCRLVWLAMMQPRHDLVVTMTDPPLLSLAGPLLRLRHGAALHWSQDLYPELLEIAGMTPPRTLVRLLGWLSTAALRRHDVVVAIGRCMARRYSARGVSPDRLHVLPNWAQPGLAPGRCGAVPGPVFTVLYAGTLGLVHPVDTMIDAAALLARRRPDVRFLVVAEGRRRARLVHAVQERGLANIALLPRQSEQALRDLAAEADVHLALLDGGAAGLLVPCKVQAALASGRPVILAGPVGSDAAATLVDTGAGWVVPADRGDRLAALIDDLASHPGKVAQAAVAAVDVARGWNADLAAAQFARLCWVALRRPIPAGIVPAVPMSRPEIPHG